MDVFARHRTLGVAHKRRDGYFGEAEIIGDTGEAVTQDVRRHIRWRGVLEEMLPMVRKAAKRVVLTLPREDICADIVGAPSIEIFDDRQANRTNGFTFLTILQSQTACLGVELRPFLADHFATPATGQRDLANDIHGSGVFLIFSGVAEHPTQYSILRFR